MAFEDFSSDNEPASIGSSALSAGDSGAEGSVYEAYRRSSYAPRPTDADAAAAALSGPTPLEAYATAPQQGAPTANFGTYDPDPTGAHTAAKAKRLGLDWDSNYVEALVVAGKWMHRDELAKSEAGTKLLANAIRSRMGLKRDFWDSMTDFSGVDYLPFVSLFATVGGSLKDAYDVSKSIDKLSNGEEITPEERAKVGLFSAENRERDTGTWGSKVGDLVRSSPGFMFEFLGSGAVLGAARKFIAGSLAKNGATKALSTWGLTRVTKMLADETADDAMGAIVKKMAEESAEGLTKAGVTTAAKAALESTAVRRDAVKAVADVLEKSIMDPQTLRVTGAGGWGDGVVRKVAEARAGQAIEGYLKRTATTGAVESSTRGFGRVLADGVSRGLIDVGAWGTEESTVLFTHNTSAGKALTDALTTFFVEAPLKGAELYLANRAVGVPFSELWGGTVGRQELAIKNAALQNGNDKELMDQARSIGLGCDMLEYISENTGRGLKSMLRAGALKFAPKLAKPAARVAGDMHYTGAKLAKDASGAITGVELDGLVEQGHGAEVGGVINRFVSKVLGNPNDTSRNILSDKVTAVTRELERQNVRVGNAAALEATLREGVVQPGLSAEVANVIGSDVGGFTKAALKNAWAENAADMRTRGYLQFVVADFMARRQIGPATAAKLFERMGYDGVAGEMFEERYSDIATELMGWNAEKDQSWRARVSRALSTFTDWGQLTAEATGFAFPMVARAGTMRALRGIGGGNAYTEFRDAAALFLDGTRHGAVGQWRYGDVLVGHARAVKAEQDKHDAAEARLAEVTASRPENADAAWDNENLAPLQEESRKASTAVERMNDHHQKFLASLTSDEKTGYSHLVNVAPLTVEDAELPDVEYNRRLAVSNAHARQAMSAAQALTNRAGRMGQTLYQMENRNVDEDQFAFQKAAHWVVKVAGALVSGDAGLLSENPAQWTGVDRGLPEGIQTTLKQCYGRIYEEELRRDQQTRSANSVYERNPAGHTFQADMEKAHARALERFQPVAARIMSATLAAHQARMFSNEELLDASIAEVARGRGLMFDESTRDFVATDGTRQKIEAFHEANKAEVNRLRRRAASKLFDVLASGGLESGRIMFNRTRDDANPIVDVIDIPKNLPTEEQAVVAMLLRRLPGMRGVLRAHEVDPDKSLDDQIAGPGTRQEWLDAVVSSTLGDAPLSAQSVKAAMDNVDRIDRVVLENIARDLNFQYDGTAADLQRRNQEIVRLAVLSRTLADPAVRTYGRDGALAEGDPAASPWTDYVSARRRSDGLWTYIDRNGASQTATEDQIDAAMEANGGWSRVTPKVVFTPAQILQSSDSLSMMRTLGLMRQYRAAQSRAGDDVNYKDPLFREGAGSFNDPAVADRVRAEEKALSDLFERNSRQSGENAVRLYLRSGEKETDAGAMSRARECMERAQAAFYRRNDEERGYAKLADDLLRRCGVSVPYGTTGLSVGSVNSDLRGKYTISVSAFRARRQSGNIYVSIDHEVAQNYDAALLSAVLLDAYARNKRLIGEVFDSGLREFMDGVDRVARLAQESAKDPSLVANIADFRAATVAREKTQVRKPSPQTFALLTRAFALYQTEQPGNLKSVLGDFAPALKEIAGAVRALPSFQVFNAVVDRVFGGTGFNPTLIRARGGIDGTTGLARLYSLFAPGASPMLSDAISKARPGGLSLEEFIQRVGEADASSVRAGLNASRERSRQAEPSPRPASSQAASSQAATPQAVSPMQSMAAMQEQLRIRREQLAAGRAAQATVVSTMAAVQGAVAGSADEGAAITTVLATEQEPPTTPQNPVVSAPIATEDVGVAAARARLSEIRDQQTVVQADVDGGDTSEETADTARALADEAARISAALGEAAAPPAPEDTVTGVVDVVEDDAGDDAEDVETDDYFFVAGGMSDSYSSEDTAKETDADGKPVGFQLKDHTELTDSEIRGSVSVIAKVYHSLYNSDPREDLDSSDLPKLSTFIKRFVPGIREVDLDRLVSMYQAMDAKAREDEFQDLWTFQSDDVDEAVDPDGGNENHNDKSVAALQSKALANFLAFAQLVNPITGRQFQGFMEDLRNTVARSIANGNQSDALKFVSDLVNPRARDAVSPTVRDAYFAETLAKFMDDTRMPEVYSYLRELLGVGSGHPLNRKAAWMVGYLAAMPASVRRQMTQLVSSSAPSVPVRVRSYFLNADGNSVSGKLGSRVVFVTEPRTGSASRLSTSAVSAAFRESTGMTGPEIRAKAQEILDDAIRMKEAGEFSATVDGRPRRLWARGSFPSYFNSVAKLFDKHFGGDSTFVSVFASTATGAQLEATGRSTEIIAALAAERGAKVPYLVDSIIGGLQLMADFAGDKASTPQNADLAAVLTFTAGDPRKGNLGWITNTSKRTDQLGTIFRAYEEVMPQTIMTAEVDPDRSSRPASSVAITMRGVEPAVQVFMDRMDSNGFRAVCEKFFPQFAAADEATKRRVLGMCRQSMCWPTALRQSIVAKSLSKSATSVETYLGCETAYNLQTDMRALAKLKGTDRFDAETQKLAKKYGYQTVARFRDDNTFNVPVYSGDRSSSILVSVPLHSQFAGKTYADAAKEVSTWVGLDLLGTEAKRSATTSLEAPGVGFIGLKHNVDGSVKYKRSRIQDLLTRPAKEPELTPVSPRTNKAMEKDRRKFGQLGGITKYVGFGYEGSSTDHYGKTTFANIWNTGEYVSGDVVGVSVNGQPRRGTERVSVADPRFTAELDRVVKAGATVIADTRMYRDSSSFNVGERELATYLASHGYSEYNGMGIWAPASEVAAGQPETGECRVNIFWNSEGDNESMLGTALATGYGVEQLKLCAKDPKASTLKFHAMNVANTGVYGEHLSLTKALSVGMGQTTETGEFGEWTASRVLMDFIRRQRSSDFADSTSIATDFDSVKLAVVNSKMLGVMTLDAGGQEKLQPLMKWFFDELRKKLDAESKNGKLKDSYEGDELDTLIGEIDWVDYAVKGRSGMKRLSQLLDGARLDAVEGLNGRTYSLSYRDNDIMGFPVANVSHRATTKEKGGTHYGRCPRNHVVDAFTMAQVLGRGWNADAAAGTSIFTHLNETVESVQDLIAAWGDLASDIAARPETANALLNASEDAQAAKARGEPVDGRFMRDILSREIAAYLRKQLLNIPMKGIDAPLVSNMSWVGSDGKAGTHSVSEMFRDTLRGSLTIPKSERRFMRGHRRMAICNLNNTDASFRYGMYLDNTRMETAFGTPDEFNTRVFTANGKYLLSFENLEGANPDQKTVAALDVVFTRLRALEAELLKESAATPDSDMVMDVRELRRRIASMFLDHHGNSLADRKRAFTVRTKDGAKEDRSSEWFMEASYDDLFTGLVRDAQGRPTFDRTAVYTNMHLDADGEGAAGRLYLGGTLVGLPRTPSYNGSMWLQTVRAGLPVTESGDEKNWKAGYDAMVAPDPFTLKILGCDHDGDKTKLYTLEAPSIAAEVKGKAAKELRDASRFLDVNAEFGALAERRRELVGEKPGPGRKATFVEHEWQLKETTKMQANNSFVQALFDMARALPVMDNSEASVPFYTGEHVSDTVNHGAAGRGTKAALTALEKSLKKAGVPNAGGIAWDTAVTNNSEVIGPAILDPASGGTLGVPRTAAEVGGGAQNAADAREIIVSLASALHIAYGSGLFAKSLFHGAEGSEGARDWLDFIYHLDGFSNMTFDDIKEQVCSRLGVTAGMMDTIIADMINVGGRNGRLPRTDAEFIDAFTRYAKDIRNRGSRYFMLRATNKSDYAMQAQIRALLGSTGGQAGSAETELTGWRLRQHFGVEFDTNLREYAVSNHAAPGAALAKRILESGDKYDKRYRAQEGTGDGIAQNLLGALVSDSAARPFNALAGYAYFAETTNADTTELVDMLAWFNTTGAIGRAKRFARSVNFLTADPVSPTSGSDFASRVRSFGLDKVDEDNPNQMKNVPISPAHVRRLKKMHAATIRAYEACRRYGTVQQYGQSAAEDFETNVTDFVTDHVDDTQNGVNAAVLATKLMAAQHVHRGQRLQLEANAQMVGLSLAAMRTVRQVDGSKIGSHNIHQVLEAIAKGSASVVRRGMSTNPVLDMRRGIEDIFELMYRLVGPSTSSRGLPIFAQFSERPDSGAKTFDNRTFYGDDLSGIARANGGLGRITLAFQGVTEGQISEIREMYRRVVEGRELDSTGSLGKRVDAVYGTTSDYGFTISAANLDKLTASRDFSVHLAGFEERYKGKAAPKTEMTLLVAEAKAILGALEPVLGKNVSIEPSALFGQLLPVYAALTSRVDRVPDSRSTSIVSAMGDTYHRWAEELANLDRTHGALLHMLTAVDFSPVHVGAELAYAEESRTTPPQRLTGRGYANALAKIVAEMNLSNVSELLRNAAVGEGAQDGNVFRSKEGRAIIKALHQGRWETGNPEGRYNIDIFGNNGLYRAALWYLDHPSARVNRAPRTTSGAAVDVVTGEIDDTAVTVLNDVIAESAASVPQTQVKKASPHVEELVRKMNGVLKAWTGARVEYKGGNEFFIYAKLRGTAAEKRKAGGVETTIKVKVVDRVVPESDRLRVVQSANWQLSNANRRSAVEDRLITADEVAREVKAMAAAEKIAYFEKWCPAGVTTLPEGDWAIEPEKLGVLCREITLADQTIHPNVVYHEYFHAVMSALKEIGTFSAEDVEHLQKYGKHNTKSGWFNEEAAAEDFRRFVETNVVVDEKTKTIFQKLLDVIRALFDAMMKTGIRSSDYENGMNESPLAMMVLTGHAMTSQSEVEQTTAEDTGTAATAEEADKIVDGDTSGESQDEYLIPMPPAPRQVGALEERFHTACANALKTRPVAGVLGGASSYTDAFGEHLARMSNICAQYGWAPGDSITKFPQEPIRKTYDGDSAGWDAIACMSREGLISGTYSDLADYGFNLGGREGITWLYRISEYIASVESTLATSVRYADALREAGRTEAQVKESVARQLEATGKGTVAKFNALYGHNFGTHISMIYRGFLERSGTASTFDEDSMYASVERPLTPEETMEAELDMVIPDRMSAPYAQSDTIARAVGMAIRNRFRREGLDPEAREVLSMVGRQKDARLRGLERAAAVDAVRLVAAQNGIDPASISGAELENLAFRAIVELNSAYRGGSRARGPVNFRGIPGTPVTSTGSAETKEPFHVTSSTLAGAIMAACGTTPAAIGERLSKEIRDMRARYAGSTFEQVLDKFAGAAERLETLDPTRLCEDPTFREDTLGDMLHSLEAGLVGGNIRADGSRENYSLAKAGASWNKSFEPNRALYGNFVDMSGEGSADFQHIAHRVIDSLYTVLAGMKFYRTLGFEPGDANAGVAADIIPPNTPDQTAAYLGVEARQLLEREGGAVDFYDQPYFVANNIEAWLQSTVRNTFGKVDVGEFMRTMNNRHAGYMRRVSNEENWNAGLMGLDVLPGQPLRAVEEVQGKFQMDNGVVRRKDGKTYYRFVRYNADLVSLHGSVDAKDPATGRKIALTEDEARMCDIALKADKVWANGGRRVVTGVDGIRFSVDDPTTPGYYSRENVELRRASGEEYSEFDRALRRLDKQMAAFVVDGGLRTRFVNAACAALATAKTMESCRNSSGATTNFVIRELEKAGVAIGHETFDFSRNEKMYESAVITLDVDDVESMFQSSSAKAKLLRAGRDHTMEIDGRQVHWLDREARVRPLMAVYREVSDHVRQNPWLTDGDGAFFNNFRTPIPFMQGSGVFMYNANRKARGTQKSLAERMTEEESTFKGVMDTLEHSRTVRPVSDMTDAQARLLAEVYGLRDSAPDHVRAAILAGSYAPGAGASRRTGLVLRQTATIADVTKAIYDRLVEAAWRENGDPVTERVGGMSSVARMIAMYEEHKERDSALSGGLGMTDEQMYRINGVLPANAQLGHAVHNAMEGITNALAFRSALVNMLMTPDAEGRPTCYADPNLMAAEAGGVPDGVWATIARWWADSNGLAYDESRSGVRNAHDVYKKLHDEFSTKKTIGGVGFGELKGEDIDAKSITGFMAQNDDRDAALNKLGGGYALGYAKHLLQASRNLGSTAQRAVIHRSLAYSKSLSVGFSMFFPLATKWESPIGAVGAVASLGSNLSPDFLREHAEVASALQKMFGGKGWITNDFLGFRDIVKMMDSNDPFLSEMIGWTSALGVPLSDSRVNPIEPQKSIVQKDIQSLVEMTRDKFGAKYAARVDSVMRTMLTKSGEKSFTYALNATKLATVAQICMKLRHEAEKTGRAFDPVRDLKRYSGYINAEIGGIDPLKYAWAHPMNRSLMNMLMFSWEWTRGAWEAGGGGIVEDFLLGGHSVTAEERKYIVGRWCRMYGVVMIGIPVLAQFVVKGLAMAMGHDDDDDEKWWTWQNEDKTQWTAFDITPLLRAMTEKFPEVAQWKKDHRALGAVLPMYTGSDRANRQHGAFSNGRHYYMHFGKQGWEFLRWFNDPIGQFFSKLSMPTQRILDGLWGRSLSWLDHELPWSDMGFAERWLTPSLDSATANLVKAFLPFTLAGLTDRNDAGFLSAVGPIQMGASDASIKDEMAKVLKAYAFNDRRGLADAHAPYRTLSDKFRVDVLNRDPTLTHLMLTAKKNGATTKQALQLVDRAVQTMTASLYGDLFDALPEKPDDQFDAARVSKLARACRRLGRKSDRILESLEAKFENRKQTMDPKLRALWADLLRQAGGGGGYALPTRKVDY